MWSWRLIIILIVLICIALLLVALGIGGTMLIASSNKSSFVKGFLIWLLMLSNLSGGIAVGMCIARVLIKG
jgi:hypothetical protein